MALRPGERVRLIQQLADSLQERQWEDIDLLLKQFGLPWTDNWNGTPRQYLLQMLADGPDEALRELHGFLFGIEADADEAAEPDFWLPGAFRLFISHVSAKKERCGELKAAFGELGVSAFLAHEDIEPTREWVEEIERALATCDALLAVLSPGFKESAWTDQEVGFCHGRRVLIVAVRQGVDPYGFISRYQAVSDQDRAADLVDEITDILLAHEKTAARMAEATVASFVRSHSYAQAKARAKRLQHVASWTPPLLRQIEEALETNSQIADAYGVPSTVKRILREHGAGGDQLEVAEDSEPW